MYKENLSTQEKKNLLRPGYSDILSMILALGSLFILSACGGASSSNSNPSDPINPGSSHKPIFTSPHTVIVNENQTNAITLSATDEDGDSLTYSISGTDASSFDINGSTGLVTFKIAPDYESGKISYLFTAVVSDGTNQVDQAITIDLKNLNDNSPIFQSQNIAPIDVNENQTNAITVSATDTDGDSLTYSISGADSSSFHINSSTGVVTFKTAPDYESGKISYLLTATVSDGEHSISQDITVNILDIDGPFVSVWETNTTDHNITIPTNSTYTYDYAVDWGDGSIDHSVTGTISHVYSTDGDHTVKISGTFPHLLMIQATHYFFATSEEKQNAIQLHSIQSWGDISWKSFDRSFTGCKNLKFSTTNVPDLSQVTNMQMMFSHAEQFNSQINNWDVQNVTNMFSLFKGATNFNQPLSSWNASSVTTMHSMFQSATNFDQPLNDWDVSSVTNMSLMFLGATNFNQPLNDWDVRNVINMSTMFQSATNFDQPLNDWDVSSVTNMSSMFLNTTNFNQPLNDWDVSNVTNMSNMFKSARSFNQPLNNWDVSSVTNMSIMFLGATNFNQPLNDWDVSSVTNMQHIFYGAIIFNQPLNDWDISNVTNMKGMFYKASNFNQPLNDWNVSKVLSMESMFKEANSFNQPLNGWEVDKVTNMKGMFYKAGNFNQPLNSWQVSRVTDMRTMFYKASAFNQSLGSWDVGEVTHMRSMFGNASSFSNHDLSVWDVQNVTNHINFMTGAGSGNTEPNWL